MFCSASSGPPAAISPSSGRRATSRRVSGLGDRRRLALLAPDQLECARLRRVAAQQACALEVREVRVHRRGRGEPDVLADLAHGRRVAVAVDVLDEEVPDLLLPGREHERSSEVARCRVERVFATRVETPADAVNGSGTPHVSAGAKEKPPLGAASLSAPMRWRGLEPPRPQWPLGPQPSASTNSATSA